MKRKDSTGIKFNKTLFCLYQSTSDDLMFWCWFDVLILSLNYGFDMTQISLLFTVSFWVALILKFPAGFMAKKLGAGRSVLLSAFLFLIAALLLTFGSTLFVAILGQSIYLTAGSFQEMSTVIAKNAARRDPANVDYMKLMSETVVVFSAISLIAALCMNPLYEINADLPMYVCIGFCINSLVLAFFVSRYETDGIENSSDIQREALPGVKIRSFDKTTLSCLFLSILFMVIFKVSGDNLKILIESDLAAATDKNRTVLLFSMVLLGSRLVKILSNILLYVSRDKKLDKERVFSFVVAGTVLIGVLAVSSRWQSGYFAVLLAVLAFLLRVMLFDPFRFSIYDFMLKRLKDDKMIEVLFVQSTGSDVFTAMFSTISTILLSRTGMPGVMWMLLIICIVFAAGYLFFRTNLIRANGSRKYLKWKNKELKTEDDLMVAAAALLLHYGVIQDSFFTPQKLAEKASSVENISAASRNVVFDSYYDYHPKTIKQLFESGHPCAVRVKVRKGDPERWLSVLYMDDDGGVVWNPYSDERFLSQMHQINKICCFTIQ